MSIAKSDEIKNLLVSNSELMVMAAYPHTYCRVVPLQTACEIVNNILENRDMHKTIAEEPVICASNENVYEWYARHVAYGMNQKQEFAYTVHTADRR